MLKKTYYLHSYGCQMNLADSGILSAAMDRAGFSAVLDPADAGVIVINTCSVREKAEERALGRLTELSQLKRKHTCYVCAVGCMAQRMGDDILKRVPEVDFILGTERLFELPRLIAAKEEGNNGGTVIDTAMTDNLAFAEYPPVPDNPYSGLVTITRGCNNFCAYCIVPYLRGRERHRDPNTIVDEVNQLVERGVVEITLVGQNVNSYEFDNVNFPKLLKRVAAETDIERIRFITSHPKDLSDELIELFASEPKLMGHIHLPLQSGSDRILDRMFRRYTYDHYKGRVQKLREAKPDIALTTDLIVGFPSESEDEYNMTLDAVREIQYDAAFMFRYSVRSGTWAAKNLIDDIPEETKLARLQTLIDLQKDISALVNQREIGKTRTVLVDGTSRRDASIWKGKTEGNKTILIRSEQDIKGRIVPVTVLRADSWTLHGEIMA
ncbi:MAG: tRNA (N6-isopentenyl adenosine(37)-C2)-methylthiotransferase MiaB [Candidatus Zixiibacteriota bacterium]